VPSPSLFAQFWCNGLQLDAKFSSTAGVGRDEHGGTVRNLFVMTYWA